MKKSFKYHRNHFKFFNKKIFLLNLIKININKIKYYWIMSKYS